MGKNGRRSNYARSYMLKKPKKTLVRNQKLVKMGRNWGTSFADIQNFALRAWHSPMHLHIHTYK